jgi:DNA-binding LacI/PurR family transcriptional regulator
LVTGPREDEVAGVQVGRLVDAGHVRLGYAMPADDRMAGPAQLPMAALSRACRERGLPEPVTLRVPIDPEGAGEVVNTWRTSTPPITGICAHDTTAALAVLAGLRSAGMTAPDDLAVVGVNGTRRRWPIRR